MAQYDPKKPKIKSPAMTVRPGVRGNFNPGAPSIQHPGMGTIKPGGGLPLLAPQGPAPAPSAAPAAPAPFVPGPDPNLLARQGQLGQRRDDANADIQYDEGRIRQDYGFDDTSNPYSRAAILQRSFQDRQRGTTNTLAARGQLYSGAIQNQRGIDQRNHDQAYDQTRRSYDDALRGIITRRRDVQRGYDEGNLEAIDASTQRQIDQRPDPLTLDPATAASADTPAPKSLSPAAAARRKKRQKAGVMDTRGLSPAAIKRLRQRGLLPG